MGKDLNTGVTEDKISRINSAGLINITIENLWKDCYNAMSSGDLNIWNTKLDAIWLILGGDEVEGSEVDTQINKLDIRIYELGVLKQSSYSGFKKSVNNNAALQYQLLKKKSLFLHRLQNKQGKGTAYTSDDDFDFD